MTTPQDATASTEDEVPPREAWDAIAEGYDRYVAPQEAELASEALAQVGLKPGERFLDVAAGTGGLSLPAARLGAHVIATDWSPAMIERFEARVRAEGLTNAEGRVMDCHALEFEDDSFDVTGSQFGVMQESADGPRALRETVRVTRPGGRVVLVTYGAPAEFEALQLFVGALHAVVPDFPGLPEDLGWVTDPDEFADQLTAAGLKDVRVARAVERPAFQTGDEMWDWTFFGNPIPGMLVADLTDDQRSTIREVLDRMLRERSGGSGPAVLSNAVNISVGTK